MIRENFTRCLPCQKTNWNGLSREETTIYVFWSMFFLMNLCHSSKHSNIEWALLSHWLYSSVRKYILWNCLFISVFAYVCICVRMCARARVRVCIRVYVLTNQKQTDYNKSMPKGYLSWCYFAALAAPSSPTALYL